MKKFLKIVLSFFLIIVVVIVVTLGYFGFVPGVSAMFGSDKPRDLGSSYTAADLKSAEEKLHQTMVDAKGSSTYDVLKASGTSDVDTTLTAQEFAAHVEAMHPIKDVQIVFHTDGSFAASGLIDKAHIVEFAHVLGFTDASDADIIATANRYLPGSPAFYIEGTGSVTNGTPSVNLSKAEIGRISVPTEWATQELLDYAQTTLHRVPGFNAQTLAIENGQLKFVGTTPKELPRWK